MTKYLLALLLLTSPSYASIGLYSACTDHCWNYNIDYYSADEIRQIKPDRFCKVFVEVPKIIRGKEVMVLVSGYSLQSVCEKNDHMAAGTWNFINPVLR